MTPEQIAGYMQVYGSWHDSSIETRSDFIAEMADCSYGPDALLQAWNWFKLGWNAGYWSDADILIEKEFPHEKSTRRN